MANNAVIVREVSLEEAFDVNEHIPEFQIHFPYTLDTFRERTAGNETVCLIGDVDSDAAGYVVGYDRDNDGSFYCWMAGVKTDHRQKGVLKALMAYLSAWAKERGYKKLTIKTRNNRREMLCFLVKNGFNVTDIERKDDVSENRILFEKELNFV